MRNLTNIDVTDLAGLHVQLVDPVTGEQHKTFPAEGLGSAFKELRRFYVDPNGSDTEGNGAAENPYLTPQAAIDQLQSGFIAILNEGVTGDFTLSLANTAVAGASSAYASSTRPNNVTVSTPIGTSNLTSLGVRSKK